jgi:hypothetical protein
MIRGLALLWAVGLGGATPSPPRLRLSFQGRCTWQAGGLSLGWAGKGISEDGSSLGSLLPHVYAYHQILVGLVAFPGHLQLTLSWPQSLTTLPTVSLCFPRKTTPVSIATDLVSVSSPP